jgi:DNA-binding response OmpR family regulator
MRILVVEDDRPVTSLIQKMLERENYTVEIAGNGEEACSMVGAGDYDLVILDLTLPGISGLEVLRHMQSARLTLPVLVVSGRRGVEARVKTLDEGADDYLTKPFSMKELLARVRALLRRRHDLTQWVLRVEDLELDRVRRVATRAGRTISLTPHEFALLEYLVRNMGRCVTRSTILEHAWKYSPATRTNVVDVYINYLRKKVDEGFQPELIHTVRGVGYQLGDRAREKPDDEDPTEPGKLISP